MLREMYHAPMQAYSQYSLLAQRRFAPLFWTQFLGAANDNIFKFAFTLLATIAARLASSGRAVLRSKVFNASAASPRRSMSAKTAALIKAIGAMEFGVDVEQRVRVVIARRKICETL